jgi:hypothetical protein
MRIIARGEGQTHNNMSTNRSIKSKKKELGHLPAAGSSSQTTAINNATTSVGNGEQPNKSTKPKPAATRWARNKKQYRRESGPGGRPFRPFRYMKTLKKVSRAGGATLNVLAACTQMANADGYFPLDEKTILQIGRRCSLAPWQVEHNVRRLVDKGYREVEAPEFMELEAFPWFGAYQRPRNSYPRDNYHGRLGSKILDAVKEARK